LTVDAREGALLRARAKEHRPVSREEDEIPAQDCH
jgi:hypothetical protein